MGNVIRDVPFETGRAAQRRGIARAACPYPHFMESAERWLAGGDSAADPAASESSLSVSQWIWHGIPSNLRDTFLELVHAGWPAMGIVRRLSVPIDDVNACLKGMGFEDWPLKWIRSDAVWKMDECARLDELHCAGVEVASIGRELLKELLDLKISIPEIALRLDRTSRAVEMQMSVMARSGKKGREAEPIATMPEPRTHP